jgi:hypothetical protein
MAKPWETYKERSVGLVRRPLEEQDKLIAEVGGGRVVERGGRQFFVSPGYSTSDPERIRQIMQGTKPAREMVESEMRREMVESQPISAAAAKVTQGIPYIGEFIPEALGTFSPVGRERVERLQRATEEEYPILSAAGRMGAAAATGLLAPGTVPTTVSGAFARGALFGGSEAAVSGFGAAEGDFSERATEAIPTGVTGAVLGSSMAGLIGLFTKGTTSTAGLNAAARKVASELGISKEAAMVIGQTLSREGSSLEDALQNIRRAGDQGMIADADIATAKLLDAVIASSGEAATVGRGAVTERAAERSQELTGAMTRALGAEPVGRRTAAEQAAARYAPMTRLSYAEAYASPINYTSPAGLEIENLITRVPADELRAAFKEANDVMQLQGIQNQQIRATINDDGSIDYEEMPNVIQLDYLKRAMQRIAYSDQYTDKFGRPTGKGAELNIVAGKLRDALGRAVPSYDRAVSMGGNAIRERQAGELGNMLLNDRVTRDELTEAIRGASKTEMDALRLGVRNQIDEIMANVKTSISTGDQGAIEEARKLLRQLSSGANRQKLQMILTPQRYGQLNTKLGEIRAALELQANVAPNSATAIRQKILQDIEEITGLGMVGSALRGEPLQAGQKVIQALTGMTDEAMVARRNEILTEVAQALTQKRGKDAEAALRYVSEAIQKGRITEAKANFVNQVLQRTLVPAGVEMSVPVTEGMGL